MIERTSQGTVWGRPTRTSANWLSCSTPRVHASSEQLPGTRVHIVTPCVRIATILAAHRALGSACALLFNTALIVD